MEEKLIKQLLSAIRCGVCGQEYGLDSVTVLGKRDEMLFLQVVCNYCLTRGLVAIVTNPDRILPGSVDVELELTHDEAENFKKSGELPPGEADEMRRFLVDFNGDFIRLFGKNSS